MTILNGYYLVQVRVIIWSKLGVQKKGPLGPDNIYFGAQLYFKKRAETSVFYSALDKPCLRKQTWTR